MVKTGKDLLDRKVVDDMRMIDVGMIWGVGFPSDKGGSMKWADLNGMSKQLFGKKHNHLISSLPLGKGLIKILKGHGHALKIHGHSSSVTV